MNDDPGSSGFMCEITLFIVFLPPSQQGVKEEEEQRRKHRSHRCSRLASGRDMHHVARHLEGHRVDAGEAAGCLQGDGALGLGRARMICDPA